MLFVQFKEEELGLPGGPVAKTCYSNAEGPGLIPGQETRSHMQSLHSTPKDPAGCKEGQR